MATSPRRRASDKTPAAATAAQTEAAALAAMPPAGGFQGVAPQIDPPPVPVAFGADGSPMFSVDLAAIVALTVAGGFAYTPETFFAPLAAAGDVEVNTTLVHPSGMLATRASQQGIAKMTAPQTETTAPAAAPAAPTPKASFEIESGIAIPAVKRSPIGHGNTKYPFDALQVGQSFFVPEGSVKSLASTVASANERYSEVVPGQTRQNRKGKTVPVTKSLRRFVVRNDVKKTEAGEVKGARIFRVEIPAGTETQAQGEGASQ